MNAFSPITPRKAVELVEAAGIEHARRIVADFAAAGLVKSYALVIERIEPGGASAIVRGATISPELWQRIVSNDADWSSGTVRLAGSDLVGGEPAAIITGITFKPDSIDWLIDHNAGVPRVRRRQQQVGAAPSVTACSAPPTAAPDSKPEPPGRPHPNSGAIPSGALFATIDQAMKALGVSRGTINNLINNGKLARVHIGRAARIEVASIRAFLRTVD